MKQYLLSVYEVDGEPAPSPEAMDKIYHDVDAVNEELKSAGAWVFAGGLHPRSSATVLRVQNDEVLPCSAMTPSSSKRFRLQHGRRYLNVDRHRRVRG
jgi:hypothetical protein